MNKNLVIMALFTIFSSVSLQASLTRQSPPPPYSEFINVSWSMQIEQLEQLEHENKNLENELVSLRREASQFKTGNAVLEDFNQNDNDLFLWYDLSMVRYGNVAHDEIENLKEQVKALQAEQDVMNRELQALKNWKYYFDLGVVAVFSGRSIEQAWSEVHKN